MHKLFTLLLLVVGASVSAQLGSLPTIDDPQDADRIFSYTRGASMAFRLDTLKSYFLDGGKVIDTIYAANDTIYFDFVDATQYKIPFAGGGLDQDISYNTSTGEIELTGSATSAAPFRTTDITPTNYDYNSADLRTPGFNTKILRPSNVNGPPDNGFYFLYNFVEANDVTTQLFIPTNGNTGRLFTRQYTTAGGYGAYTPVGVPYTSGVEAGRIPSITTDGRLRQTGIDYATGGVYSFLNGNGAKMTALKSLEIGQTGDQFGGVSLLLRNRQAHNGLRIVTDHPTINLVDLQFKTALDPFISMRSEARSGNTVLGDAQQEIQFFYAPVEGASSASLTKYFTFGPNRAKFHGNAGLRIPVGNTAQRWADQGAIRYNTTLSEFEGYDGSSWVSLFSDGNGIYGGSGSVPDNVVVSSKLYPTGTVDGSQMYFSELQSLQYYTGWNTLNEDGEGFELLTRRNSSGTPQATYLKLADGNDESTFASRTWYYTNLTSGYVRGIDWGRTVPAYRVAASDFLDIPSALPTEDGSVFVNDADGSGAFQRLREAHGLAATTNYNNFPAGGWNSENDLDFPAESGMQYGFRLSVYYDTDTGTDAEIRFDSSTGAISGFYTEGDDGLAQSFVDNTALLLSESTAARRRTFEGTFTVSATGTVDCEIRGVSGSFDLRAGTEIEIFKIN